MCQAHSRKVGLQTGEYGEEHAGVNFCHGGDACRRLGALDHPLGNGPLYAAEGNAPCDGYAIDYLGIVGTAHEALLSNTWRMASTRRATLGSTRGRRGPLGMGTGKAPTRFTGGTRAVTSCSA